MINEIFTSPELRSAWQEWLTYRKERKLPKYVPTGLRHTITHLETITGKDEQKAIAFIHYSIAQNYQGIFPDPNYAKRITENNGQHPSASQSKLIALSNWGRTGCGS